MLFCTVCINTRAQVPKVTLSNLAEVLHHAQLDGVTKFDFNMSIIYPNKAQEQYNGFSIIDSKRNFFAQSSSMGTCIMNDKFYYKADHDDKTVQVINIKKKFNTDYIKDKNDQIFKFKELNYFIDSIMLRYGKVSKVQQHHDTMSATIIFPSLEYIKSINLKYLASSKAIVMYEIAMFQVEEDDFYGPNAGTSIKFKCKNYKHKYEYTEFSLDKFFIIERGQVKLKKYINYSIDQHI